MITPGCCLTTTSALMPSSSRFLNSIWPRSAACSVMLMHAVGQRRSPGSLTPNYGIDRFWPECGFWLNYEEHLAADKPSRRYDAAGGPRSRGPHLSWYGTLANCATVQTTAKHVHMLPLYGCHRHAGDEHTWSPADWEWDPQAFTARLRPGSAPAAFPGCALKRLRVDTGSGPPAWVLPSASTDVAALPAEAGTPCQATSSLAMLESLDLEPSLVQHQAVSSSASEGQHEV